MDPAKMKVVDLRSELSALGLDTKGNKPALVERLKKALETKTGSAIADTTILDTSTEDTDEVSTPQKAGPAARTRRRSSSIRPTPSAKVQPREEPEQVVEEEEEEEPPQEVDSSEDSNSQDCVMTEQKTQEVSSRPDEEVQILDDESKLQPIVVEDTEEETKKDAAEPMETNQGEDSAKKEDSSKPDLDKDVAKKDDNKVIEIKEESKDEDEQPQLTEEEEWELLNERLIQRERERKEREKLQAEEDAKKLEEIKNDPVKLQRYKRKQEKKARWGNFYRNVEVTNKILAPVIEEPAQPKKVEPKEPELNDERITLSWYDSDLNQYLELPELTSVTPLTEGGFAYAWAGVRASHGVTSGRVCYEVKVGPVMTTKEDNCSSGLRLGWSSDDSTLHLGEGKFSWGFENSGRAVHDSEFKQYGKSFNENDIIGVYLDLESSPCKILYTLNGDEQGVAYEFDKSELEGRTLFPHVLTKNICYRVNFGYDRYNMLTKTLIVRKRIEIPVEEVLKEKREIQRQKEEAKRRNRSQREEKMKKKKEEEEKRKQERAKQQAEVKGADSEKSKDGGETSTKEGEMPKENGDAPMEVQDESSQSSEKPEAMATDQPQEDSKDKEKPEVKKELDEENATKDGAISEVTEEQVFRGIALDPRIKFVIRYEVSEELSGEEACLVPGFILIAHSMYLEPGPRRPATNADCEVILMVGLPGSGKTHWAREHAAKHPERRYNIISTAALFDRMKVDCKPFRSTYEERWDAMVSKCAKCVLKMLEMAQGRRRNFILDQTNVYPSAQRRKLRDFDGYRRVAVVVVPDEATYEERHKKREQADGKEVPDGAIIDMKANFVLPEKCAWLDEVIYAELQHDEAKLIIDKFHKEAKAAGVSREKEKRERSPAREAPVNKRPRQEERRGPPPRERPPRDFGSRDREDRWGIGGGAGGGGGGRGGGMGGGSRWGGGGAGGGGGGGGGGMGGRGPREGPGRWDRQPPPRPFDRPPRMEGGFGGDGGGGGGRDFREFGGRGGDGFRGGRGGGRGGGPGGPGPRGDRGPARPPLNMDGGGGGRPFGRNNNEPPSRPVPPPEKRNQGPSGGGGGGGGGSGGGGGGSWQRGGAMQTSLRGGGAGGGGPGPAAGPANRGGRQPPPSGPLAVRNQSQLTPQQKNQGPPNKVNKSDQIQTQNQNQPSQNPGQQQNQPNWNQWNNWGWGNWNQNQGAGWGGWGNWGNWGGAGNNPSGGGQQGQAGGAAGAGGKGGGGAAAGQGQGQQGQGQWPANYQQQWYQWQQWQQQQQQQQWQGYQGNQTGGTQDQQQMWAQYYQNYGNPNALTANSGGGDKKGKDK